VLTGYLHSEILDGLSEFVSVQTLWVIIVYYL
jgi:hypothetical protein